VTEPDPNTSLGLSMPFPFTLYDFTFDTDTAPFMYVSSAGGIGFFPPDTGTNTTLPNDLYAYAIFGFWGPVSTGTSGVCHGLDPTSTAPNRRYVFTWEDASTSLPAAKPIADLTFSIVLEEGTDKVYLLFHRWSANTGSCTYSSGIAGNSETVGIEGTDEGSGTPSTLITFNGSPISLLPIHGGACPGLGKYYTLSPTS
jgi:hypothetical protein